MTTEQLVRKASNNQKKSKITENRIAKTLHTIGIATIIFGIIGSFILSASFDNNIPLFLIVGAVLSFITGMCFIGFSEIIILLQRNANLQNRIIDIIKNESLGNRKKSAPKTVLQDIESNLPQI